MWDFDRVLQLYAASDGEGLVRMEGFGQAFFPMIDTKARVIRLYREASRQPDDVYEIRITTWPSEKVFPRVRNPQDFVSMFVYDKMLNPDR